MPPFTLGKHEQALRKAASYGHCLVTRDKQHFPQMEYSVESFFPLLTRGNLTPLMVAEILELKLLGLRAEVYA